MTSSARTRSADNAAEEAEDTQVILGDPLVRITDEAHALCRDVLKTADVIVHDAAGIDRQAVDGEVAPLCIGHPVAAECNLGLAAERLGVLAQRGDLERLRVDDQRHGAVVDAGRHASDAGSSGTPDHFLGQRRCRDIDFADRKIEQRIADRAADHPCFLAIAAQEFEHAASRTGSEPGRVAEHARFVHLSTPGTNFPFSICAGI